MSESQQLRQVFVSHAHEDSAWCNTFVGALRQADVDVWYDEHNLGYGVLMDEIERQLRQRHVFLVVLSPAAVASRWVRREVIAAITLHDTEPDRIFLPIMAQPCEIPLLWREFRWLRGLNDSGLAPVEAAREVLRALGAPQEIAQGIAQEPSPTPEARQWDEASFLGDLRQRHGEGDAQVAMAILEWAAARHLRIWWGKGRQYGSFFPMVDYNEAPHWTIAVWTYGSVEVQFQWMKTRPPFDKEEMRAELLAQLNTIPGVRIPTDAIARRPSFPLSVLHVAGHLAQFLRILDWELTQIRS